MCLLRHSLAYFRRQLECIFRKEKDTRFGYMQSNVCLICQEFNIMDLGCANTSDAHGGWSRAKFRFFLKTKFNMDIPVEAVQRA